MSDPRLPFLTARVGAHDYSLQTWPTNEARAACRFGECDRLNKVIRIDLMFGPRKTVETLLHELLHATFYELGVREQDDEERVTESLASGLTCLLRDNPGLFTWFDEQVKRDDT